MKKNLVAQYALCTIVLVSLVSCASSEPPKLNAGTAKQFLKLRGYNYDEQSFLAAAKANDAAAINAFLAAGMDPNTKDQSSLGTPLISAAAHGDIEIVRSLLNGGANVNERDRGGNTALLRALETPHDDVAELLLAQQSVDLNAQGLSGLTVLMRYVGRDREEMVRKMLERGANVSLQDNDGDTALHNGARRGNVNILRLLLGKGADPNVKNKVGGTPLMWAAVFGHSDAVRVLLENGADASLKDNKGMTAAAWAVENKRDEIAEFLRTAEKKK